MIIVILMIVLLILIIVIVILIIVIVIVIVIVITLIMIIAITAYIAKHSKIATDIRTRKIDKPQRTSTSSTMLKQSVCAHRCS